MTIGKSSGDGNEASTCTTGCSRRDSRADRPMASPAGMVQSVPTATATSTRQSVHSASSPKAPQSAGSG